MIDYINHRLVCWAEWATRRDDGGLGWARQAHYTKAVLSHSRGNIEELNEEAMEIEAGVLALRSASPAGFEVVMEFYRKTGSAETKARSLRMHKDTMYSKLHATHIWLMNWLQDRAIEQHDKAAAMKRFSCHA